MGNLLSNDQVKLGKKIGEGSYGEVYTATWKGRQVAAKKIRSFFFEGDYFLQNQEKIMCDFRKEWEILSRLNHPNILEYYAVVSPTGGVNTGPPMIITELCHTDLYHFIRDTSNRKVQFQDTVAIMMDVARGLEYLHGLAPEPIIHRDLSSKNILLTEYKRAKICDLGLAKAFPSGAMFASAAVGCPIYAAPETYPKRLGRGFFSQKAYYTEKIDIFSFGAILLEVIVGRLPHYLPDPVLEDGEVVPEHYRRSEDIEHMGPDHPLRKLVLNCIDNLPEDRPSAAQLVEFLLQFKSIEIVKSQSITLPASFSPPKEAPPSYCTADVSRFQTNPYDYAFKVAVLGFTGVGKTSIIRRFIHPEININPVTTFQPGDSFERLQFRGKTVHLHIVDTPGELQSPFHNVSNVVPQIYRKLNGTALVFDVSYRETFTKISKWLEAVRDRCGQETAVVLVGNKTDIESSEWKVSSNEAQTWALQNDMFYIETSATGHINIDEIFCVLIEKMIQNQKLDEPGTSMDYSINNLVSSTSLLKGDSTAQVLPICERSVAIPLLTENIRVDAVPENPDSQSMTRKEKIGSQIKKWCTIL